MPNEFVARNGIIALNTSGITGSLFISNNVSIGTLVSSSRLQVSGSSNVMNIKGSGSAATSSIFTVDGAAGRLFTVNDSLSGSLFSVNTIAGLPVIEAFSDNTVRIGQYGQKALFVSQSKIGIGLENPTAFLHITGSTGALFEVDGSGSIRILVVSASGRVGIGTDTAKGRFDIAYAGLLNDPTILLGADDTGGNTRTNNTDKLARIGMTPYNNNATASAIIIASSTATTNNIFVGGGSSYLNSATAIQFYTGATTASISGFQRMSIDSTGSVSILSGSLSILSGSLTYNNLKPTTSTVSSLATSIINVDISDTFTITAQSTAISVANPIGTPVNGQKLILRIKDNGTARAITWSGTQWRASSDLALPTTTIINKTLYTGFIYNSSGSGTWDLLAYLNNF